ncbi:hypothetical protein BDD12DRAFT_259980 [Trichophaea hybrida]|nr:hypothetical protein BDD12DRAFT_259980 [Trichophaea hybrida]
MRSNVRSVLLMLYLQWCGVTRQNFIGKWPSSNEREVSVSPTELRRKLIVVAGRSLQALLEGCLAPASNFSVLSYPLVPCLITSTEAN